MGLGAIRGFRRRPLALRGRGDGVEVDLRPRLGVEERLQPIDGAVEAAAARGDHQVDRGVGLAVAEVPDPARRGMQVGAALLERPAARRRPPGRHRLPRPGTPLACLGQPQRREPAVQRRERAVVHRAEPGLLQVVRAGRGGLADPGGAGPAVRVLAGQAQLAELGVEAGDRIGRQLGEIAERRVLEGVRGQPVVGLAGVGVDRRRHDRLGAVQEQLDQRRPASPAVLAGRCRRPGGTSAGGPRALRSRSPGGSSPSSPSARAGAPARAPAPPPRRRRRPCGRCRRRRRRRRRARCRRRGRASSPTARAGTPAACARTSPASAPCATSARPRSGPAPSRPASPAWRGSPCRGGARPPGRRGTAGRP